MLIADRSLKRHVGAQQWAPQPAAFIMVFSRVLSTGNNDASVQFLLPWLPKSVDHSEGVAGTDLLNGNISYEPSVSWEGLGYGYKMHYCHVNSVTLKCVSCFWVTVYAYS